MKKLVYVVCGLNASRSRVVEDFLRGKYKDKSGIEIRSAGLDVDIFKEDDKKTLFTEKMARESSLIFVSDEYKLDRTYDLLGNGPGEVEKVHNLRIPDIFHGYINADPKSDTLDYSKRMKKVRSDPEFRELIGYIKALSPMECSDLIEALYLRDLYSARQNHKPGQDRKYPFELLYKTLEFRFPKISELIDKTK